VYELVKNCYDANATDVYVDFKDASLDPINGTITISDNGTGMSFSDIRDKWMVVGTNSKRTKLYSDPPFDRKFVGEKGIGRFAVDKLGERLLIRTKTKGERRRLNVTIKWDEYETKANAPKPMLFTEMANEFFYEPAPADEHGTTLVISRLSENWSNFDLDRLYIELSKIVSPFYPVDPPFDIFLNSNTDLEYRNTAVKADPVKYYSHYGELSFDLSTGKQQVLKLNQSNGKIQTDWIDIQSFGPIKMRVYYFNESAKKRYRTAYKNDESRIDGIKIYRDGIITTPFAEYEGDPNKKRDILGIDKRRWRGAFDKVGTREIIGVVDISKQQNPNIIDATNRQDFIDNSEYRRLKEFIIEQIDVLGELKDYERKVKRSAVEKELQKASDEVKQFSTEIRSLEKQIVREHPQLKGVLTPLVDQASTLGKTISDSISEQKKFEKDVVRKEKIYLSLMSLQDYAANISHAVRTSLGKIKRSAEFFVNNFPNPTFDDLFKEYALFIYGEMNVLLKVTDFMLSYASSELDFEDVDIKELIESIFLSEYRTVLEAENISVELEIRDTFIINTNKRFFHDIFGNLISNSIKALRNTPNKVIKCSGLLGSDAFDLYFSDNGYGITKGDEEWIFGLYNTRTADKGGAGIGLYIVEKRIEALRGSIEVAESEFKPIGATFKITFPFDRD